MIRLTSLYLIAALLAAAQAGEITVESRPFTIESAFDATALPDKGSVLLQLRPTHWKSFKIIEIAEHGHRVTKGDILVRFDPTDIERILAHQRRVLANIPTPTPTELATGTTSLQSAKETLAAMEADRAQCEMKAPADGWFYHGLVENGRWTAGEDAKSLVKNGRPAENLPFATFIPATAKLGWVAFLDEARARALTPGCTGVAQLAGREDLEIPVKLVKLATVPALAGSYRADLTVTWPKDFTPVAGITARIHLIAYYQPAAIALPNNALAYGPQGWSVAVKLTDGTTERRTVKRGRASQDATEILSGLEVGQVVLAP